MIKFLVNLITMFIPIKKYRVFLRHKLKTLIYGWKIIVKAKSIGKGLYVGGFSECGNGVVLGDYVHFNGINIMGGNVKIGNHFHSGADCVIIPMNHNYEGETIPYDKTYQFKDVVIEDYVWMGARVTVLPGTKIGEGVVIQAGSVVHGEIPPCAIIGGNPAKVFKYRNVEHFQQLKKEGKVLPGLCEMRAGVERERERERERVIPLYNNDMIRAA